MLVVQCGRFFYQSLFTEQPPFAFVALTGSGFVLRAKNAHMGAVPASQAFSYIKSHSCKHD